MAQSENAAPVAPAIQALPVDKAAKPSDAIPATDAAQEPEKKKAVDLTIGDAEKITDTDPLIKAIAAKDENAVRAAIAAKSDINRRTVDGSYPIIVAAVHGTADIMKILTAYKVNVTVTDTLGRNAMHYAAILGDVEKMKLMSAMRAPVNAPDKSGMTPLFYAYLNKEFKVAEFLTQETRKIEQTLADVNQMDENGEWLAVYVFEMEDNIEAVKQMIAGGLNVFKRDKNGHTLIDIANKMKKEEVAKLLQTAYDERLKAYAQEQKKLQEPEKKTEKK